MKNNKLLVLPAFMALLLGSCGPNSDLMSEEKIIAKMFNYKKQVSYSEFFKYKSAFNNVYPRKYTSDYVVEIIKSSTEEFDSLSKLCRITQSRCIAKVDGDNKKYNLHSTGKTTIKSEGKDESEITSTTITCKPSKDGFISTAFTEEGKNIPDLTFTYKNWKDALDVLAESTEGSLRYVEDIFEDTAHSTYYVDGGVYTKVKDDNLLYQLTLKNNSITFFYMTKDYRDSGQKKLNGATHINMRFKNVRL